MWQGWREGSAVAAALVIASLLAAGEAHAVPRNPRLRTVHTWAFAIGGADLAGNVTARYAAYDLVVLDGQEARARQIRSLRASGKLVLAYLDVGTIEPGRPWYRSLKPYRLNYWPDFGEWYADVSSPGFRGAMARRIAPSILHKGFDGLFLDNTDMIESHPRQRAGMRSLVSAIAHLLHRHHRLLFSQNGEGSIASTLRYYDGWNREDVTSTYSFSRHSYVRQPAGETARALAALRRIGAAGLLVLATDYTAAADAAGMAMAVRNACGAGALPFVSDIGLTRVPAQPARCS